MRMPTCDDHDHPAVKAAIHALHTAVLVLEFAYHATSAINHFKDWLTPKEGIAR